MPNAYDNLEAKRLDFRKFDESVVRPLLGLNDAQLETLGYVEIAVRIADSETRQRFCRLAIDLLDANIAHYQPDATRIDVPQPNNTMVVVTTILVAGVSYSIGGAIAAFLVTAAWYWMAAETQRRRQIQLTEEAKKHNDHVVDWETTIQNWESVRNELVSLQASA